MPADTHALAGRPTDDSLADGVNRAGHLVPRHARVLNPGPKTVLHQRIAVANAASRDFDPHSSRRRLWYRSLDNLKLSFRCRYLCYTHRFHDLMNSNRSLLSCSLLVSPRGPISFQVLLQHLRCLMQRVTHSRNLADCVEQSVVVNEVFVAHAGDINTGRVELARIGQPFIAKNVVPGDLDQSRR